MTDLSNGAIAPTTIPVESGHFTPSKDLERFDPIADAKVVIDQEGFVYKTSELDHFLGKIGAHQVELASLKLKNALDLMQKALESKSLDDCQKVHTELGKILHPANKPVDFQAFRIELVQAKSKPEILETPAKFRLTEKQINMLKSYHSQSGKSASTIFEELGKLLNGKSVLPITTISKYIKATKNESK